MSGDRRGDYIIKILLFALNILAGIAIWFGAEFSKHVDTMLEAHEKAIVELRVQVGVIEQRHKDESNIP